VSSYSGLIARHPHLFVSLFPRSPPLLLALTCGQAAQVTLLYAAWRWGTRQQRRDRDVAPVVISKPPTQDTALSSTAAAGLSFSSTSS